MVEYICEGGSSVAVFQAFEDEFLKIETGYS
jgi:hypothetical protein